ncbi:hypothetical protein [Mycolicibacter hiberniae]|uniref:Twin-arginine translocation pathway signal n=1 Tax=Mycolicibacter hiberniae TaxID=29314 RepID=A0A7I7X5J6_9MYCO|nr:hypothetical protein [Mycolicibacter hiberniae]BBZ23991.1 hypothetical protein MHIB_24090 [Mycolicibacter hiberniae]
MTVEQGSVAPFVEEADGAAHADEPRGVDDHVPAVVPAPGVVGRAKVVLGARRKALFLGLILAVTALLATVLYVTAYRPVQQSGDAAGDAAVRAASSATVALLSYAPETLDQDIERSRTLMSGDFLTYYSKFTTDVVAPAVRTKGIKATAQVVNAGLMEIQPNEAKVLVFLNQETVSRERPEPALTASSVVVSLAKVDAQWLISALDPV